MADSLELKVDTIQREVDLLKNHSMQAQSNFADIMEEMRKVQAEQAQQLGELKKISERLTDFLEGAFGNTGFVGSVNARLITLEDTQKTIKEDQQKVWIKISFAMGVAVTIGFLIDRLNIVSKLVG